MTPAVTLHFDTFPTLLRVVRKQTGAAAVAFGASELDAGRVELAVGDHSQTPTITRMAAFPAPSNWKSRTDSTGSRSRSVMKAGGSCRGPADFSSRPIPKQGMGTGCR